MKNVLFLTLLDFNTFDERNIYSDLLREFIKNGHNVYCISPVERRRNVQTHFEENGHILKLKIGNTQKTNIIEKGFSTLMIESRFVHALKKYFSDIKFDLVLYSTPPITLVGAVNYIKKRDGAKTYLMLKDIFPQNAVDLGMISKSGLKGCIYKYFRAKEKRLYKVSDKIGCMSQANVNYILENNPEISSDKVEVCPNCIDIQDVRLTAEERMAMRQKYEIPSDKKVFVLGGNLGKPQGIPFLIECLKTQLNNRKAFFLIVGDGTEAVKLREFLLNVNPSNIKLMQILAVEEYDRLLAACDVGMLFLDHRFTIPNFPSRILGYMQAGLPILACTDANTDMGQVITNGGFGKWCESDGTQAAESFIDFFCQNDVSNMGQVSLEYLKNNYSTELLYEMIAKSINKY
ncbi:MAG: glycosyltransferase family 4 protein [Clostridia bacterium]|nr:glycosyltransferase family 4 protein [Clostridia bacterium]